ncbi:MAG: gdh, partial [Friedmanniella sp.]|nr:gdh [Friedmanniella sp.]
MSLFEVEQERDKKQKIEDVAARGAAVAAELGQDPDAVTVFLHHYFRHVDAADVDERAVEDLLGLVESHYRAALHRAPGEATIAIRTPSQSDDGWTAGGATVVQIVTDDHPFLVDSVTMEVLRQGWSIREVFHPQFSIRRDAGGSLQEVLSSEEAAGEPTVLQESWMHLEILPPPSQETPEALSALLEQGLREVLLLVEEAVTDWEQMMVRSGETVALLADPAFTGAATDPTRAEEAASASELLTWLNANHFTFLGYREYRMVDDVLVGVPGTGLGISRADQPPAGAFQALPPRGSRPVLMVVTKDSSRSRVHRPAYLDYLGFRSFSPEGEVVGERRFLGLFSSSAYSESVARVPVLRQKALGVLQRSGYDAHSHGGKAIIDVLETYPRDELFQTQLPELSGIVEKVAHLKERRQVRLFVRRDPYGRYLSCLIFLPRDRYTTAVRNRMEEVLMRTLGGGSIDYSARVTESVLARLHFVVRMPTGQKVGEVDVRQLERELTLATRSWEDEFADRVAAEPDLGRLAALVGSLPEGYKEEYSPRQAILDLQALSSLAPDADMSMALYVPERADDEADLRLKIFRRDGTMSLSRILPHLSLLGVDVIDERPYELGAGTQDRAWIYEFGIRIPGGRDAARHGWDNSARHHFMAAFEASYSGLSEPDAFNALVMGANLSWRQVGMLRAVGRYLRQAGSTYSQTYLAQALSSNVDIARTLVTLFETRFDPALDLSLEERRRQADAITAKIIRALGDVASLDHDRIVRSYLAVLTAVIRTNAFQPDRQALTLKLLPRLVPDLPEPRPAFEIFVYSPRLEGVHLRFGAVARGGLRWSDRAEDFRTEILGLVKAQMVKNTVIVPVGAKGGF